MWVKAQAGILVNMNQATTVMVQPGYKSFMLVAYGQITSNEDGFNEFCLFAGTEAECYEALAKLPMPIAHDFSQA